jgi:hypothetical protein
MVIHRRLRLGAPGCVVVQRRFRRCISQGVALSVELVLRVHCLALHPMGLCPLDVLDEAPAVGILGEGEDEAAVHAPRPQCLSEWRIGIPDDI